MAQNYFDQNITDKLCNNQKFLEGFSKNFKSYPNLIITPRTLIELSGAKVKNCLKNNQEYKLDIKDLWHNQVSKAYDFCENNIRGNIIPFLNDKLKNKKNQYAETLEGRIIITEYQEYLNSLKGITEIPRAITLDRFSALPWEEFKHKNTYFDIYHIAVCFLTINRHTPILRLLIKSARKIPPSNDKKVENKFRKPLIELIEKSDISTGRDLIDTEMIQFAIMGYKNYPLYFYTTDNPEKIKTRLHLFDMLINRLIIPYAQQILKNKTYESNSKKLSPERVKALASRNPIFGKIFIVEEKDGDDQGSITETIDVKDLLHSDKNNSDKNNKNGI